MISVNRWTRLVWGVCCLVWGQVLWAAPQIDDWYTHNGARVLFVNAPELPMVDVRVVFDAGSARDGNTAGLAEMTNTLLNDGAGAWDADQIAARLESVGAKLGFGAARDMAWVTLRTLTDPEAYDRAVGTLAVVLGQPTFEQDDLERNRKAMQTALRVGEQEPGTVAEKAYFHALYRDHPYAIPSDGTSASLEAITREQVVAFYRQYYVAKNARVAIIGALDRPQAEALAERVVGELPSGESAPGLPPVPKLQQGIEIHTPFLQPEPHLDGAARYASGRPRLFPALCW